MIKLMILFFVVESVLNIEQFSLLPCIDEKQCKHAQDYLNKLNKTFNDRIDKKLEQLNTPKKYDTAETREYLSISDDLLKEIVTAFETFKEKFYKMLKDCNLNLPAIPKPFRVPTYYYVEGDAGKK